LYISHLRLSNFRNYANCEIDLPPQMVILHGDNAQGKSNFLESVYLLATTRSFRATNERELINWSALHEHIPVCRIEGDIRKSGTRFNVEIAIRNKTADSIKHDDLSDGRRILTKGTAVQKRIRVNNIVRRAVDLIGEVNVVAFNVQDISIIGGEPALRRRYLDITNSQVDRQYLRKLRRYQRVLWQRNRLLREISGGGANRDELSFWTDELVSTGSYLTIQRRHMLNALEKHACNIYRELTGEENELKLIYLSGIDKGNKVEGSDTEEAGSAFSRQLQKVMDREIIQGLTLVGPHRDELRFMDGEIDLGIYGSRGQQRLAALALKLAEAKFMMARTGEHPILLLDDIMSELDNRRRNHLMDSVRGYQQVLMTATDLEDYTPATIDSSLVVRISKGYIL